jgi:DNA-binding CsgD family transcriptional regulator
MVTIDDFSRMVSAIYASALTPEDWIVAMADVGRTLGGQGAALIVSDGRSHSVKSAAVLPEAAKSYREYYCEIDYVLDAVEKGPVGLIRGGQPLVALKARSEFETDFMRPYYMDDGLFVRLTDGAMRTSFLVAAPKRSEPFDTAERVKLLSALVPHLQQALGTQDHLNDFAHRASGIAAAVDTVQHGIAVVGAGSTVKHLNSAAQRILRSDDGLCARSGSIEATCGPDNAELHRSIAGAVFGHECGSRSGDSFLCRRPSGKRPYVIHVLPFAPTTEDLSEARALVILIDPEQQPETPTSLLRRVYGLTNAEADVALRVLHGDGLKPISEELSLSMATIKTHLQHIFAKTYTHRQAELVRLLLTITP